MPTGCVDGKSQNAKEKLQSRANALLFLLTNTTCSCRHTSVLMQFSWLKVPALEFVCTKSIMLATATIYYTLRIQTANAIKYIQAHNENKIGLVVSFQFEGVAAKRDFTSGRG
jgi:hypothetical protein